MATPKLIAVYGPTASGKTLAAEWIADHLDAQLISADAFQVYRGFDIGTNKPADRERYQLIDVCDPDEQFGVGAFILAVLPLLEGAFASGRNVVLVGGTGLYMRALIEQWENLQPLPDPNLRERVTAMADGEVVAQLRNLNPPGLDELDFQNPRRIRRALERALSTEPCLKFAIPGFETTKLGMSPSVDLHNLAIETRTIQLVRAGWLEEVQRLLEQGVSEYCPAMKAIGYDSATRKLRGELSESDFVDEVVLLTKQYAKRQRTWLRSEPGIVFLESESPLVEFSEEWQAKLFRLISP